VAQTITGILAKPEDTARSLGRIQAHFRNTPQEKFDPLLPVTIRSDGHQSVIIFRPMAFEKVTQVQKRTAQDAKMTEQKRNQ
jgi:hypothetical protein